MSRTADDDAADATPVAGPLGWVRRQWSHPFGPIKIAIVVASLLTAFGLGAALLSPVFAARPDGTASTSRAQPPETVPPPTAGPSASPAPSASPSSAPAARGNSALEDEIVALVNDERAKAHCNPLRHDERLRTAARWHSTDLADTADRTGKNTLSHDDSDGSSPWDRMRRAGYDDPLSENVAFGYRTAKEAMRGWMRSKGHKANILDCDAKAIGVGVAYRRGGVAYWTQDFGRR